MLLPDFQLSRLLSALGALCALIALAACSFAPVYGSGARSYNLQFASPETRLEQIVYQDLVTRFGRSTDPQALLVSVAVSNSNLPGTSLQGDIRITRPDLSGLTEGEILYRATRTATASSQNVSQRLAAQQANVDAAERAAHQLAEAVRLTLLGVLTEDGVLPALTQSSPAEAAVETGQSVAMQ